MDISSVNKEPDTTIISFKKKKLIFIATGSKMNQVGLIRERAILV
jgi:ribosomal protein S4E